MWPFHAKSQRAKKLKRHKVHALFAVKFDSF
jgi:hypothetical protein